MNNLHLLDIPSILSRFTDRYMFFYGHKTPKSINNGECFVWAWGVYNFLKDQGIPSTLMTCTTHGGHAWIEINGLAYDSEHTTGVCSQELADDFAKQSFDFFDPDFFDMEEQEFFDHWENDGRRNDMLIDINVNNKMKRSIVQIARNHRKIA